MRIEFEQQDKEHISIIGIDDGKKRREIGHIFTPSGSGHINLNAIQICGFDEAFDLWGCGIFGDSERKVMKKDIQLCWFGLYDQMSNEERDNVILGTKEHKLTPVLKKLMKTDKDSWTEVIKEGRFSAIFDGKVCGKCFNYPCTCENLTRYENPYTVKREQDLWLERKKEEDKKSSP